jgi:hypothetical protein
MNPLGLPEGAYNPWQDLAQRAEILRLFRAKAEARGDFAIASLLADRDVDE